jgi:hypothetical protein
MSDPICSLASGGTNPPLRSLDKLFSEVYAVAIRGVRVAERKRLLPRPALQKPSLRLTYCLRSLFSQDAIEHYKDARAPSH